MKLPRQLRYRLHRHVISWWPRRYAASARPVTVLMPLAVKDLARAHVALGALREHLLHPIERVVVPGQKSAEIARFCADHGAVYVDETEVLPRAVLDLDYTARGYNLNGWMRQQILKLTAPSYAGAGDFAVFDSDTVLLRGVSFFEGARQILFTADEYVGDYHAMNERLLGPLPRQPRSFVAHFMLFQADVLAELTRAVEARQGCSLTEAVLKNLDRSTVSGLSEYELYGNFLMHTRPDAACARYWYNVKAKSLRPGARFSARRFNSVSDHVY